MKVKLLIIALLPLLFASCDMNDLFDEGDTKKTYDGPAVVEFFPTEREVGVDDGSTSIGIQLVGEQQNSDLAISFGTFVDSEPSCGVYYAEEGTHYNLTTSSPVTLSSGTSSVNVEVEILDGSLPMTRQEHPSCLEEDETSEDLEDVDVTEVRLVLELEGADGFPPSENYKTSTIFIQG